MRKWLPLVALATGVIGCGPMADNPAEQPVILTPTVSSTAPELIPGKLALIHNDDKVQIGMKVEDALAIFSKPPAQALTVNTLPKGFPPETYAADGWESVDGAEGFGVISVSGNNGKRVAVAILRMRMDTRELADDIVSQYKTVLGETGMSTQVSGELTYTLWEEEKNQLMILEAPIKGGKCQITFALGVLPLSRALRFDPESVKRDTVSYSKETSEPSKP
jgi:hypothetical protein